MKLEVAGQLRMHVAIGDSMGKSEEERMTNSYLEKGLGPSLLVERLLELSRAVKNKPH